MSHATLLSAQFYTKHTCSQSCIQHSTVVILDAGGPCVFFWQMDRQLFVSCFAEGEVLCVWWVLQQPWESPATPDGAKQGPHHQDLPSGTSKSWSFTIIYILSFLTSFSLCPTFLSSCEAFPACFVLLDLFLPSCHLHFHVNTSIKGRNYGHVRRFFLPGQDAATIKATVVFPLPAVSVFWHSGCAQ